MKTRLKTESNQALEAMKVALPFGLFSLLEKKKKTFSFMGCCGAPILGGLEGAHGRQPAVCTCWTIDNHQHLLGEGKIDEKRKKFGCCCCCPKATT
jgi:Zn finger protein HypA/HybF involved in hydrogenase expression